MKFSKKVYFALHKNYFDRGASILGQFKINYLVAAVFLVDFETGAAGVLAFGLGSYILGRFWFWSGMVEAEQEVSNKYNLFVREMRRNYKKPTNIKPRTKQCLW